MSENEKSTLVVAITARALFHLEDSHGLYEREGVAAYAEFQRDRENDVLVPGIAFPLVRKLLALNQDTTADNRRVEVILLSRNSSDTGLRIFNSIEHHGLGIVRAVFTSGAPTYPYIVPFGAHLFLSANPESVRLALEHGVAAATILPSKAPGRSPSVSEAMDGRERPPGRSPSVSEAMDGRERPPGRSPSVSEAMDGRERPMDRVHDQLRIAFDGDAVIFGDESERISQEQGIEAFARNEREKATTPLSGGPFRGFLAALHQLQAAFPVERSPIRTALVTARSAPAHKRVILTLREWDVRLDEALFLGGRDKGPFLEAFGADIFFDDTHRNVENARRHVATGHVPHGVSNP